MWNYLSTQLHFVAPRDARARLDIHDVQGRMVATLLDDHVRAGLRSVEWKGMDNTGRSVASGVYLARLRIGQEVRTQRIVRLR